MLEKNNIYFLGAGGIGMSALIRYFLAQGKKVAGYDKTPTGLTEKIISEGALLHFVDEVSEIPVEFTNPENTTLIYTPAIPKDSKQFNFFKEQGFVLYKRSEILGAITKNSFNIGVSGTHGKTTISSMIAHGLKYCDYPFTAFLGGVSKNLQSNYYHDINSKVCVIEADEYDRSFLRLSPDIITVSAVDPDHLDIYGTPEEMVATFRKFLHENLKKGGLGIIEKKLVAQLGDSFLTYSISDHSADFFASNIRINGTEFLADFNWKNGSIADVKIGLPGIHNMENALVAFAALFQLNIPVDKIKNAIAAYIGVDRRFDIQINNEQCIYIDDYAHHPEEIRNLVTSVKKMYPDKKITGVFQPHLFSRTQDFLKGFARSLELLDTVILLDIYPARELPIPGVSSQVLLDEIKKNSKMLCSKKQVLDYLNANECSVVLTIGAGDIGMEVEQIKSCLLNKTNN